MKKKRIFALVLALLFIAVAAFALVDNKIDYSDFATAEQTGKRVQVSGSWVKEQNYNYDSKSNTFTFTMKDHKGNVLPVRYDGMKPNNFEIAPSVVCVGKVESGVFVVSDIQTKCPSRYEGSESKGENKE
ncbi:MAG TPA: cytochrome c maturation protein CcmE [Candidatus Kapabacteria bacterium]|nr:cytochrome c maturation protein CcmE [Candidatus Kapabacteria bacterium]